jgi:hypothetical protein
MVYNPKEADDVDASCWQQMMAARAAVHAARIEREQAELGIRHIPRGRPCPVIRSDGTTFPSVSEAARLSGIKKPDNICDAIRRGGGTSGGYRWAYVGQVPENFLEPAALFPPFSSDLLHGRPLIHITTDTDASALLEMLKNHRISRISGVAGQGAAGHVLAR